MLPVTAIQKKRTDMKKILSLILAIGAISAQAQINAIEPTRRYEGEVEYNKTMQKCQVLEFNYPAKDLEKATQDYVSKMGGKIKSAGKGWNVAKGVRLHRSNDRFYDLYYKIDGTGKGDRAQSKMSIIVSEPGENLVAAADQTVARGAVAASAGAAAFFSEMGSTVGEYDLNKKIAAQEDEIRKAQKKYDNLVLDAKNLETKRTKLEKDIADNKSAQAQQQQEVDRLKALLEQIKSKKGN